MENYNNFKKECEQALKNNEIEKMDELLLLKIAKAINEEDKEIKMELQPFYYANRHIIECWGFVDNFQEKIRRAIKKAYIYHQNVSFGFTNTCMIKIPTSTYSKGVKKAVEEKRERNTGKKIGERRKQHCQFSDLADYIAKLVEKGKYEKCDGIFADLINNISSSCLTTEEELLKDLQAVIDGTSTDYNDEYYIYDEKVHQIAKKYNSNVDNIKGVLTIKIRCFDQKYLYKSGFFDLTTEDHEIVKRKLKGEPFDDVEPFKLLSEIEL